MNLHWLSTCVHMAFVIDRIEPPFAIVEWAHSAAFTEIAQDLFPHPIMEGDVWTLHLHPDPQGTALRVPQDRVLDMPLPPGAGIKEKTPYRFRVSRESTGISKP